MCILPIFEFELDLKYGYFQILRWIVSATASISCFHFYKRKNSVRAVFSFIIAALFNPIKPIELGYDTWLMLDISTAILLPTSHLDHRHEKRVNITLLVMCIAAFLGLGIAFYITAYLPHQETAYVDLDRQAKSNILFKQGFINFILIEIAIILSYFVIKYSLKYSLLKKETSNQPQTPTANTPH